MIGRIIEIADDQRYLSVYRGFLVVKDTGAQWTELARIPLDDVLAVIANAHGMSYSNNLLVALAERGAPFVVCGANHNAVGMLLPIDGNYQQAKRFDAQLTVKRPLVKRLWADIIRDKLERQASVLESVGGVHQPLRMLAAKVRSGDPENTEAQGARYYWSRLFGETFRRDRAAGGTNALLNYGYTVLRAATVRSIVAAGLHPTIGLHHTNESNSMRLADDLMEPFRPIVDLQVKRLNDAGRGDVVPETKRDLVSTLFADLETSLGRSPVTVCIERLAASLAQVYLGSRKDLELPYRGTLPITDTQGARE